MTPLRYEHYISVEQQKARQTLSLYQSELLPQPCLHPLGHPAVSPCRCLVAESSQVARGCIAIGHYGTWKGVAEIGAEIEVTLLRDAEAVG